MHRFLVALLAAFDALVAVAVGVAVPVAVTALLWAFDSSSVDASVIWPAAARVWQLGHLVPMAVTLPVDVVVAAGIPAEAAAFTVSLAPLAFAVFTVVFACRSGRRAGVAGAPWAGVGVGALVVALAAVVVQVTVHAPAARTNPILAVLLPTVLFAVPAAAGAVWGAWEEDDGLIGRLREAVDDLPATWRGVPDAALRGGAVALFALAGLGAVAVVVGLVTGAPRVLGLYQAGGFDLAGVITVSLAQLAYVPTLVVWAMAFLAGPGVSLGEGGVLSPAGVMTGPVPGIPALGILPQGASPWLLVVVLAPVAAGVLAGWVVRSRMPEPDAVHPRVRVVTAGAIAVCAAAGAALLAVAASGSIGPGRLAAVGPSVGAFALAAGVEVFVGAALLLLGPVRRASTPPGRAGGAG